MKRKSFRMNIKTYCIYLYLSRCCERIHIQTGKKSRNFG